MQKESRFITNTLIQYNPQLSLTPFYEQLFKLLIHSVNTFNQYIDPKSPISIASKQSKNRLNYELFSGLEHIISAGGNLMVYLRLYSFSMKIKNNPEFSKQMQQFSSKSLTTLFFSEFFTPEKYLEMAQTSFLALKNIIQQEKAQDSGISFYCGSAGIWLLGCHLNYYQQNKKGFQECLQQLLAIKKIIFKYPNDYCYEILYGVAGYLYCLLDLQCNFEFGPYKNSDFNVNLSEDVISLTELIINKGIQKFCLPPSANFSDEKVYPIGYRLYYTFHDKEYFSGAHGLFGVLYMIMKANLLNKTQLLNNPKLEEKIYYNCWKSFEFLKQFQLPSGNYPSSERSKNDDRLMQFCHGATGAVAPLLLASQTFPSNSIEYQQSAERCCQAIWKEGILKKGYGLCHGISGNGGRYAIGISDHPFSLMQGLAGDIIYILDIFDIEHSKFPGYEVGIF